MNYLEFGIKKMDSVPFAQNVEKSEGWSSPDFQGGRSLIDSTTKTFLMSALQKSHETRMKYYSIVFNFAVFVVFVLVFGGVLYYCHINRKTPEEANYRIIKDQEYVLSKIRYFQEENQKIQNASKEFSAMITELPLPPPQGGVIR